MKPSLANVTPSLSNKTYDVLKFIALILLPAASALYFALGNVWGWPDVEKVIGTIAAVDAFLGVLLGINNVVYQAKPEHTDGQIIVTDTGDGVTLAMQPTMNPIAMIDRDRLVFKTVRVPYEPSSAQTKLYPDNEEIS